MRNRFRSVVGWLDDNADLIEGIFTFAALSLSVYGLIFVYSLVLG